MTRRRPAAPTLARRLLAALALLGLTPPERVKDGQERTRGLLEATAEAFISMDADGLVTAWNSQAEQTFGWPAAQALGRPLAELIIPEASRAAHDRGRRRYLDTGQGPLLNRRVEVMARLFRPYDRLGAERTGVQGTGMGLALSKGLVEAMGGRLEAARVEGQGTTFTVELPVVGSLLSGAPSRS